MFKNFYKGKRVLITGHTGFKGSWLSQWLVKLGAEVAGYSIDIPTQPSHFEALRLHTQLRHHEGDVRDLSQVKKVFTDFQPDIVFHVAAQPIVWVSFEDPVKTFSTNLLGTVHVLEAIRSTPSVKAGVMITSDKCYENVEWEFGYRETDRLGGKDPYSASKACAEIAASTYARSYFSHSGVALATARAGNVIGGGDWAVNRIVPDCIRSWASQEVCAVRNPDATRPWQHVLEPLSGYLWLGVCLGEKRDGLVGEGFNFGPPAGTNKSVAELIAQMGKTWTGSRWEVVPSPDSTKKEATLLQLNCDKAYARMGWKATLTFPEAVEMTIRWYRDYYANPSCASESTLGQISEYETLAAQRGLPFTQ